MPPYRTRRRASLEGLVREIIDEAERPTKEAYHGRYNDFSGTVRRAYKLACANCSAISYVEAEDQRLALHIARDVGWLIPARLAGILCPNCAVKWCREHPRARPANAKLKRAVKQSSAEFAHELAQRDADLAPKSLTDFWAERLRNEEPRGNDLGEFR